MVGPSQIHPIDPKPVAIPTDTEMVSPTGSHMVSLLIELLLALKIAKVIVGKQLFPTSPGQGSR